MGPGNPPGLDLVLAFDASASVDYEEFDLMTAGTAAAFRDADVQAAIAATRGGIRVCLIQWSSIRRQEVALPWTALRGAAEAGRFAARIAALPRIVDGGGTMIHAGLTFAAAQFPAGPEAARRRTIDISGNGRDDDDAALARARSQIVAAGITINGLSVQEGRTDLLAYYWNHVIGGAGAFALKATSFAEFGRAMRHKLLREISGPRLA